MSSLISSAPLLNKEVVRETITITDLAISVSATGSNTGFGAVKIGDFPAGNILRLGTIANIGFDGSAAAPDLSLTWDGFYSLGTQATTDADLSDPGDVDVTVAATVPVAVNGVAAANRARSIYTSLEPFNNSSSTVGVYVNLLVDNADIADDSTVEIKVNGWVELAYIVFSST